MNSDQNFEQRMESWDGRKLTFKQHSKSKGRAKVWEIWVIDDSYYVQHGLEGGKQQNSSTKGKFKNEGKSNEITPAQNALESATRKARKKHQEGYDQHIDGKNVDKRAGATSIPAMLASLPSSFCLYKPENTLDTCKGLLKKVAKNEVLYALKRNGLAMWIVVDWQGDIQMYSRRCKATQKDEDIPWSVRFAHLIPAIKALELPHNSMMAVELVSLAGDEKKHFAHVQGVEKSLTAKALELQARDGYLGLYWWGIPFLGGEDLVKTASVKERYQHIADYYARANIKDMNGTINWIQPIHTREFQSMEEALEIAKELNLEGWVVVDPNGIYGDKGWNLKGKPDRPGKFCAKLKPHWEEDFIAMFAPEVGHGEWGKGKHEKDKTVILPDKSSVVHGGVGSVGLFQYNASGELVYISDCSSGMSYELQSRLHPGAFPFVCEIKYTDRSYISEGGKTNALSFPVFVRVRTDKDASECVNEKLL